ncbi:TIGR02680 family protein [Janthinobacterium sp. PC23-8]|uniref:TIGR02680 family protein n=1 Tax=Janthinobacterium sp. PC23-8 TaxID=2012679 RepID=UPI000B9771A3|nr:TIGR02680 family protein [Janthinobacterium sp. PC23-8]OYO28067.1 TIGR02680 family protein [Janthinobacterium sp. PC23-8]
MSLSDKPALPVPVRIRWQPLRIGVVELFHYDSEEFWFRDGHLLLRGNNGTGKSKVLSLTLPFLFDAQLKSSRIEPDGDSGKKMAWNLLLGRHERRMGYTWIEFGRMSEHDIPEYLTLGCGMLAAAARPQVESWFFMLDGKRIGQDVWLTSTQRVVLTKERLREKLAGHGQVYETAQVYRRAVDERLFHLGAVRYAALMDTLIQLRQPQLSKKPDEASLSNALTEALPPMSSELLTDVAEALNQLDEYRQELTEYEALERAVGQFNQRYKVYASTQARRQAGLLRAAQTGFDKASRSLNDGREALEAAQANELEAKTACDQAEKVLSASRIALEQLLDDPTTADAKRLELALRDAQARQKAAIEAQKNLVQAQARLVREADASSSRASRVEETERQLAITREIITSTAEGAGIAKPCTENPLLALDLYALAAMATQAIDGAHDELRHAVATRREQIVLIQRRCGDVERAEQTWRQQLQAHGERQEEVNIASEQRTQADLQVEQEGSNVIDRWQSHFDSLQQLQPDTPEDFLESLATWVTNPQGENPARLALLSAQQMTSDRHARTHADLTNIRQLLLDERFTLQSESQRLAAGGDTAPPASPYRTTKARDGKSGAPLWQLVDFRDTLNANSQAGIEAALQAAGLLDAWVMPDGKVFNEKNETVLHDTFWLERPPQAQSLAACLQAADHLHSANAPISASTVCRLLEGIACNTNDTGDTEAWISYDGRFRLGALAGDWSKPEAIHIGHAARAAARQHRLEDIAHRCTQIDNELSLLEQRFAQFARQRQQALDEWRNAPTDDLLRNAHAEAISRSREFNMARTRLEQATRLVSLALKKLEMTRQDLARDAADLHLPATIDVLKAVGDNLQRLANTLSDLFQGIREMRQTMTELENQQIRQDEARLDAESAVQASAERDAEAQEARIRHETLLASVGVQVQQLQSRLQDTRDQVRDGEKLDKRCRETYRLASEERGRNDQKIQAAQALLADRLSARQDAIVKLQQFAATGLLAVAMPDDDIPDTNTAWTIDPALTLARNTEQRLNSIKDDEDTWNRVQNQISHDYSELGRALSALGHQALGDTSDYGLIVTIVYQNRPERPDQLSTRLQAEIEQRRALLTAEERKVLENHLQAEIAAAIQKLLQDAERQVAAINEELEKRPTSTGVRFRLKWEPLQEGTQGAPVGLEAARKRLLNTSTDLWSAEDRSVIGDMLHQRISIERSRSDDLGDGSLLDQLTRALDYRRWHRFRVMRWQDNQWRTLSGPASSGERALGLTVPLFAAVSSYYTQGGNPHAPRLVLLDEAFAGIDDAARANCMGLIREFDLDFVITSEREWACYAELPGVAICQLQRREGIDAVHVSRWTWDGRARTHHDDPDRRFETTDKPGQLAAGKDMPNDMP